MKTENKPLAYYHYNTPKVTINWNNHKQMGSYFSALSALNKICELNTHPQKSDIWEICTPDGVLNVSNLVNNNLL
jgi:hypothetical protein